jgi:hypothetical protein
VTPSRGHFTSPTGTGPIGASSATQVRHQLSRAGKPGDQWPCTSWQPSISRYDAEAQVQYRPKLVAGEATMGALR